MTIFTEYRVRSPILEELDAPAGDALRASFEESFRANPWFAIGRWAELRGADSAARGADLHPEYYRERGLPVPELPPLVSAEDARREITEYGLDLTVPDDGVPRAVLDILIQRKREERVRQDILNRASGGWGDAAARLAVGFGASLLDPLNIGTAFIPAVGPTRYAMMLSRARNVVSRAGVRAAVGVAEGTLGAALLEPVVYGAMSAEQADYDLIDSLLNVALGGALGGGLHVVGGGVVDFVGSRRAAGTPPPAPLVRAIDNAAPETREALLRTSVAQMAEGRAVNVEAVANLDPVVRQAQQEPTAPFRQTDTPQFMAWFGGSKAVDANGQPIRAFHGTAENFDAFDINRIPAVPESGGPLDMRMGSMGAWFTAPTLGRPSHYREYSQGAAESVAGDFATRAKGPGANVVPVYLSIKNPREFRGHEHFMDERGNLSGADFRKKLEAEGYDGVVIRNSDTDTMEYRDDWVAFRPEQVKSAIGNSGAFDPKSPSLTDRHAPVDPRAWSNVVNDAQAAGTAPSSLADPAASRSADETLKTAAKADTPEGLEQEAAEAFESVKELSEALGNTQTLDALTREADLIAEEAETLGRAARAMAACQLRRGVGGVASGAAQTAATTAVAGAAKATTSRATKAAAKGVTANVEDISTQLRGALGKDNFGSLVESLVQPLKAADAKALAKHLTGATTSSKGEALKYISYFNQAQVNFDAKIAATAGRVAG